MNLFRVLARLALILGSVAIASQSFAQTTAVVGGTVHTIGPRGMLENATILIEDGYITDVGENIDVPSAATVIDAAGKIVTPGLFTPYGTLGLVEVASSAGPNDAVQRGNAFTASFDVADAFNPRSTLIPVNRIDGVTRALIAPFGGGPDPVNGVSHVISGLASVVNLSGSDDYLDSRGAAMVVNLGESGASLAGGTRSAALMTFRGALNQAMDFKVNADAFGRNEHPGYSYSVSDLRALGDVLDGDVPVLAQVDRASDITALMRLADEYSLRLILLGATEAWLVADELAAADIPVIFGPTSNLPSSFDQLNARRDAATILAEAGVSMAFAGPQSTTYNARNITQSAGNAVGEGLSREAALRAITLAPAEMFGVDETLGSIEAGKQADIVIWPGDPLELRTYPDAVLVRGEPVPMQSRQTLLRDRYLDLDGDRPPAFRNP